MKKSIFLFFAAILCATNAFALSDSQSWYDGNKPYLYFNNTNAKYNGVSLIQGRQWTWGSGGIGSSGYGMTKIDNTNLYYLYTQLYDKFTTQCFVDRAGGNGWSDWSSDPVAKRVTTYASNYTDSYNLTFTSNKFYVFTAKTSSKNSALELPINAGSSYAALNKTITVKAKVSTDKGATYAEKTSPGTLTASSFKFTDYKTCTTTTSLSSGEITCGYTANTTLTAQTDVEGYVFAGWYDNNGKKQTENAKLTINPTADATYYAYYVAEAKHNVKISYKYGSIDVKTSDSKEVGESTESKITAPTITGYTFSSWEVGDGIIQKSTEGNAITIITKTGFNESDYTLVANYTEDLTTGWVLKGSFVDDFATAYDFTKKSGESTGKVAYTTVELLANTAYRFKVVNGSKWYGNNNYNEGDETHWIKQTAENWDFYDDAGDCYMKTELAGTYTFKIDYSGSNPKVSVIYPIAYTITVTAENGTVEGAGTYVEGTTVSLTATPAEGYHFVKWSNESTTNPLTITVTEDIELQAIFDINTYTVTATAENGTVTGAGTYDHGTTVTLTPTANEGYHFEKWSNGSTDNPLTITVTEDVKIQAIFAINTYTVTATATEGGTVTGADTYKHGEEVTLTATANPGYKFTGWSDGETDNPYSFTITEDVTLTANFEKETYTRTVSADYYGTICLPFGSSEYNGAEFYEVSYVIVGKGLWLDQLEDNAQLEAGKPYIFKATADKLVVVSDGKTAANPIAGANGLTGTFTDIAAGGDLEGHYIIADNQVWVAGTDATLPANRAYINAEDVPTTPQAQLPGRRRVCMGENAATGLDNITNGENTTIKLIENGQLIIIRNGEKFNAQGVRF